MNSKTGKNVEITLKVTGYEVLNKNVHVGGKSGGRVYVPTRWIGKPVKVILLEPLDDEE